MINSSLTTRLFMQDDPFHVNGYHIIELDLLMHSYVHPFKIAAVKKELIIPTLNSTESIIIISATVKYCWVVNFKIGINKVV